MAERQTHSTQNRATERSWEFESPSRDQRARGPPAAETVEGPGADLSRRSRTLPETTTPKRRRLQGEGSIYVGADGRARGAILVVDPDTGAKVRRVVSGRSRADVRETLAKLRKDLDAGVGIKPGGPKTLAADIELWLPALRQRSARRPGGRTTTTSGATSSRHSATIPSLSSPRPR